MSNLCTNDSATLSFIQESLLNEEMRRRSWNELQSGGQPKALGGAALVGGHKSKPKKPPKSFGCGKVGHFSRDCSKQKGKNESGQNANHMREVSLEDAGENGFMMSTDALEIPGHALTLREGVHQHHEWFVDSGATSHVIQWKGNGKLRAVRDALEHWTG